MRLIDADALKDSIKIGDMPALTEGLKGWIGKQPTIEPIQVVEDYCEKRCLVVMSADLFEKIKREYGEAQWIR